MFDKLQGLEAKYDELTTKLGDPDTLGDKDAYSKLTRSYSELGPVVARFRVYRDVLRQAEEARVMLAAESDAELRDLAREEVDSLEERKQQLERELRLLLTPRDPNDAKDVFLEVRAGTGGEEAALFASQVVRMYTRFAERQGWKVEPIEVASTGMGGVSRAIVCLRGKNVYGRLKHESGVHRVQRVPETEASGRIHTSAVTVAMMPEAEAVEIEIDEEKDLRIDRFCSSGPGGQSVNTTYSAIRITHLPTGLVVSCQDEKSQVKNRTKALAVLRARLFEQKMRAQQESRAATRRSQVGHGDRSEKIRTYNFRENRVTDHRIGLTLHQLPEILDGAIDPLVEGVVAHFQELLLKESIDNEAVTGAATASPAGV